MTRGDQFTSGNQATVSNGTVDKTTVTAAAGVSVLLHYVEINGRAFDTGDAYLYLRDTGASTTWADQGDSTDNNPDLASFNGGGKATFTTGVNIDDTVGLRYIWNNESSSSRDRARAATGTEL